MKNHLGTNKNFPAGWNDDRVRGVIEHFEKQTPEERVAEIENAALDDGWQRIKDAIREFNKTNKSQLHKLPKQENGTRDNGVLTGRRNSYLLNWRGRDDEGPFDFEYTVCLAAQLPAMDQAFRPVLCTVFKKLKPAAAFPRSKKKLLEIFTACVDGTRLDVKKKMDGIAITGVSTAISAKVVNAESLCDALIRLEHSIHNVCDRLGSKKSAS